MWRQVKRKEIQEHPVGDKAWHHHARSRRSGVSLVTPDYPEKEVEALFFENLNLDFSLS